MAWVTPDRPPMVNIVTKPTANRNGAFTRILPPAIVAIQLKIFTPVGTAMNIVDRANADLATGPRPVANMWWAHPPQPRKAMAMPEKTMTGMANSSRNWAISVIHTKIGMRIRLMPGARMLTMVTIRLMAPVSDAMPRICRPNTQKSMLCAGLNAFSVLGA